MAYTNLENQRACGRRHYKSHKQQYVEKAAARRIKIYEDIIVPRRSKPCLDCKQIFPLVCMDFDHVIGVKKFNISTDYSRVSMTALLDELAKCEVVCANCHRVRTANRIASLTL